MANSNSNGSAGYRVSVSLSPELYERVLKVSQMMGLSESATCRYLMMRGLENLMHLLASTTSAELMKSMFDVFERDLEGEFGKAGKTAVSAGPVLVTPDQSLKNKTPRVKKAS